MTNLKMFIFVFLPLETLFLAEGQFPVQTRAQWGHGAPGVVGRVSHLGCWSLTLLLRRASCDPVTRIAVIETGDRSPTGTIAASTDIQLRESTAPMAGREGSSARLPRTSQTTVTEYVAERCDVSNHTLNRELALRMTPLARNCRPIVR